MYNSRPISEYSEVGLSYFKDILIKNIIFYNSRYYKRDVPLFILKLILDTLLTLDINIGLYESLLSNALFRNSEIGLNIKSCKNPELLLTHELGHYLCRVIPEINLYNSEHIINKAEYFSNVDEVRLRLITILYAEFFSIKYKDDLEIVYDRLTINKWLMVVI